MPSFVIFSPGLPISAQPTVLPVFGPPRVGPLGVCPPSRLMLVSLPQAVAWLMCCHEMQERVPKRWALSYHCLTKPFGLEVFVAGCGPNLANCCKLRPKTLQLLQVAAKYLFVVHCRIPQYRGVIALLNTTQKVFSSQCIS